jgi:hypothetical protein
LGIPSLIRYEASLLLSVSRHAKNPYVHADRWWSIHHELIPVGSRYAAPVCWIGVVRLLALMHCHFMEIGCPRSSRNDDSVIQSADMIILFLLYPFLKFLSELRIDDKIDTVLFYMSASFLSSSNDHDAFAQRGITKLISCL